MLSKDQKNFIVDAMVSHGHEINSSGALSRAIEAHTKAVLIIDGFNGMVPGVINCASVEIHCGDLSARSVSVNFQDAFHEAAWEFIQETRADAKEKTARREAERNYTPLPHLDPAWVTSFLRRVYGEEQARSPKTNPSPSHLDAVWDTNDLESPYENE